MIHKFLAPSSAYKWVMCSLSPSLEASVPDDGDSEESRKGTAAHEVAADMIRAHMRAGIGMPAPGGFASNGELIDDEVYQSAKVYADAAAAVFRPAMVVSEEFVLVEHFFDCPDIHELNGGTPDLVFFDKNAGRLWVWDFKHGHRSVDAYENWQLINYAMPALKHFADGVDDRLIDVCFRIVMPRCYDGLGAVRAWDVRASDLRAHFNRLEHAAHKATSGDVEAVPNVNCRDCKGALMCDALRNSGALMADYAHAPRTHELDGRALGLELKWLDKALGVMTARLDTLKAEAAVRISKSQVVEGWALENKAGSLKWSVDSETAIFTVGALGVDIAKPVEALTPTQSLEAAKGTPDAVEAIKALASRPMGSAKLIRDEKTLAAKVFAQ